MALMNAADERTYLVATIKQWNIDEFARAFLICRAGGC